ncbi:MAG: hypothetical protein ABJK37_16495 [Paraglaciecola sp.]|uniref:hypothetical protein n=1 Tax=Paraglaciecola sp. TaxID=1920173 RepID=UPI003299651E
MNIMKGQYRVFSQGKIVVSHISGQWSKSNALEYEDAVHKVITNLGGREFASLLFFEDWGLNTPEAGPIIERIINWCVNQGMCCAAEVFSPDALKEYLLNKLVKEVKSQLVIRRFSSEHEALLWLAEKGFESKKASWIEQ